MFSAIQRYSLFFIAALSFAACNKEYRQIQKSPDTGEKFDYAKKCYDQKNYSRSISVFEDIQPFMKGKQQFEEMSYLMAYAYYHSKDYFMAAHVFQNYTRLYPSSDKAEECFFMSAYCSSLDVPYYKLDQANAMNAIKQFQLFINYYPKSERVKEANEIIDALRLQQARKSYELAQNYYRRGLYNSAAISFKNVVKDFPDSKYRELSMYMGVKSLYYYAVKSIDSKQVERFQNALKAYEVFERAFPDSPYIAETKKLAAQSQAYISKNN